MTGVSRFLFWTFLFLGQDGEADLCFYPGHGVAQLNDQGTAQQHNNDKG